MNCPEFLEISVIEGAADKSWSTGIAVAELAGTPPFIQSASMQTVTKDVEVELLPPVDSQSAGTLTQRTYELRFTPRDAAGTTIDESRGIVKMNLTDQSSQSIPWRLMRQLPIKLFYDRAKGEVRGLRRSNVQGKVLLKLHPVEAGSLTNYEFEADDTIVSIVKLKAELTDTAPPPVSVEAIFSGTRDVSVVLPLQ